MNLSRKWLLGAASMIAVVFGLSTAGQATPTHAQLSCDNPPFDVSQISNVWNLTDFCQFEEGIFGEILSGGVPRDGIPPIDAPEFESIEVASEWLQPQSPVLSVEIEGDARAYPLAIMTRHEIVNDVFDERPVAVTFCPLCNSGIVFDRVVDDETLRFGVSGLLRNSDLIMWDDLTQSWWQQFTGQGIVGEFTGRQLETLPSVMASFGQFVEQYPDGLVLSRSGRSYGSNPYVNYDSTDNPFLFLGEVDDRLLATERVLAGMIAGEPTAYPFSVLRGEPVINDTVGGLDVVALWQSGKASALDAAVIDDGRDVGTAALYERTFDGETLTFSLDEDDNIRDDQTGSIWNVFGTAVEGELAGGQLRQVLAAPHFWFAWAAFQPETAIYGIDAAE
ncbi:MAG: DUF3179 domain-containing protein [Chloroflexi bacterium]|nr:DUF3179 domain-containing protein [Chloroflexota bacterium]